MRRRTTAVLVAMLAGMAVATPAGAAPTAPSEVLVSVVADEAPPVSGQAVSFEAALVSAGNPVAGATLTLMGSPWGTSGYAPLASTTTDSTGAGHLAAVLRSTTRLYWSYAGDGVHEATQSPVFVQNVAAAVTAHLRAPSVRSHHRFVVVGRTSGRPGQRVSLWRGRVPAPLSDGAAPHRVATGVVGADGRLRLTARFARPGTRTLFVKVAAGPANAAGYSRYLHVRVR
ncbi:MAG: hypothetical protein ACJ72D_23025 [Marmoricola sp.]